MGGFNTIQPQDTAELLNIIYMLLSRVQRFTASTRDTREMEPRVSERMGQRGANEARIRAHVNNRLENPSLIP